MPDTPKRDRFAGVLVGLTLAAFLARVAWLLLEPRCPPVGDEPSWIEMGRQLGRPRRGFSPFQSDLIFYPPVYPYFVGVLFRAFGTMAAVPWAQALCGALTVPAVGLAGRRAFGPHTGLLAAGLAAFYPDLLWFAAHFWSETVFLLLLWWAIERTLAAPVAPSWRAAAAAGALWGLATLTRELSLYLVPFAAIFLAWPPAGRPAPAARRLGRAAVLVAACVLVVLPWTLRNALVFRAFIPVSTMGSLNLWQGNTSITHTQIYEVLATVGGPVEQDRYCRRMAWAEIRAAQPGWAARKLRDEMPEFWSAGSEAIDHFVGREACGPLPPAAVRRLEAAFVAPYLGVLALATLGLVRLRPTPGAWFLLAFLAAYNAAHVVAYATTRFRLPVLPVVLLLAAAALVGARDARLAPLRGGRVVLLVVLVALALAVLAPGLEELSLR